MGKPADPLAPSGALESDDDETGPVRPEQAMLDWVQELAPYGIFSTDTSLRIVSWNRWLTDRSGLRPDQVIGRSLVEAFPEVAQRRLADVYRRALQGEAYVLSAALHKYLLAIPLGQRDGQRSNMLQTARIAPMRSGRRIVGTITLIEDVTQREMHAQSLRRQQGIDRLLSQTLGVLLQSPDPGRDIGILLKRIAPALRVDAFLFYGLAPDRPTLRLTTSSGVTPRQRAGMEEISLVPRPAPSLSAGEFLRETVGQHLDQLRQAGLRAVAAFPLLIEDAVLGLISFGSYDRDQYDEEITGVLSRISRYAAIAVDRTIREQRILAASRAKDRFLATLSHELRAPLNPVLLVASDAARNRAFPPEAREAFRGIERNVLLEARLIDDLLDLTRIEHDKIKLDLGEVEMHAVLRDAVATVQPEIQAQQLQVELRLEAKRTLMLGDLVRLQQVFWNVLKNAAKFTPAGGWIRVLTYDCPDGGSIGIDVTDSGIGLEPDEVDRIFDPFSQGEHGGRSFGGLGLGLAISRKLIELHKGRIQASSAGRGRGATFTLQLPVLPDRVAARTPSVVAETTAARVRGPAAQAVSILLVEDHEPTRQPLERMLSRRGYSVVSVGSAEAAREVAARQSFDLVVSDIGLPDASGLELMHALRRDYGLVGIALTGYGMEEDIVRSAAAGFVSHLTKPIRIEALERALQAALPGRAPNA